MDEALKVDSGCGQTAAANLFQLGHQRLLWRLLWSSTSVFAEKCRGEGFQAHPWASKPGAGFFRPCRDFRCGAKPQI